MKKKAFTLIELIAVLVILAILALIVTPLVMNIIRKARISADKRSIDAYGRSVELAIATYLLDNGDFPNSISDLTIEYSGDQVVCSITQLNSDSSVYITGCTVGGRTVDYVYGSDKSPSYTTYQVGDEVSYNNVAYRVIKASGADESTVTLLKATPLTVAEVNQYGAGHVNMYACLSSNSSCYQTAYDYNNDGTVGGMAYYSSSTCGYDSNNQWQNSGCTTEYAQSEVKYAVDAWKTAQAPAATGARLITINEVVSLGYDNTCIEEGWCEPSASVPTWLYNANYWYWTMSQYNDEASYVWSVNIDGILYDNHVSNDYGSVRPVITLSKANISS